MLSYTVRHLEELLAHCSVRPHVNQVEMHPQLKQEELRAFCAREGIVLEAYSSLGYGKLPEEPAVKAVASRVGRSPAAVLYRWALQHGVVILPKSVTPARIAENASVFDFELSEEDMRTLDQLDCGHHYCWDPANIA